MKEGRVKMYTVTHIYEADFGCEERADGAKAKCVVYLEDENGRIFVDACGDAYNLPE